MICLVENKFKRILYKKHINKHEELNQEFNQQVQDTMQVKI
jgi:molecular chaperone GrpE (heat shock protein)